MKFIKKNIGIIILIVIVILIGVGVYYVKKIFYSPETGAIYGNRIEGRDNVKITSEKKKQVKDKLNEQAKDASVRVQGRIIYIMYTVNDDCSLEDAKNLGNVALEQFSDEEKEYYDFQIIVNKAIESNQFPIMGYKHYKKSDITWTKDRAEN